MSYLTPTQKRIIAERFLAWLENNNIKEWGNTYSILLEVSEALNIEVYNLWKAHDLLITLGRIERISPNGKKGCRVVDYTPLTKPIDASILICSKESCPILKNLNKVFQQNQ